MNWIQTPLGMSVECTHTVKKNNAEWYYMKFCYEFFLKSSMLYIIKKDMLLIFM